MPEVPVERIPLDKRTPWYGEHLARYHFAVPHAQGVRVLDIACGSGYGVGYLRSGGATEVVGVDVDGPAVDEARRVFGDPFVRADGARLPFDDATFDLVTSFETVEHVADDHAFVRELARVLKPGGRLLMSTPDRRYTALDPLAPPNPFHLREYTADELAALVSPWFVVEQHLSQRLGPGYRISPFAHDQVRARYSALEHLMLYAWKVLNRLPYWLKDGASRLLFGRPFYPSERHYRFVPLDEEMAAVQVVVCRGSAVRPT